MIPSTPRLRTPLRCPKASPSEANRSGTANRIPDEMVATMTVALNRSGIVFVLHRRGRV